jgi:hypothetical protein
MDWGLKDTALTWNHTLGHGPDLHPLTAVYDTQERRRRGRLTPGGKDKAFADIDRECRWSKKLGAA